MRSLIKLLAVACWALTIVPVGEGCSGNPDGPTADAANRAVEEAAAKQPPLKGKAAKRTARETGDSL